MRKCRVTDEMYAAIPGLIGQGLTHFEIAAQFGVKPSSLKVLCSQRGISLRKRRLPGTTPRKRPPRMPFENQIELAWAASLVLVLMVLAINIASRLIGQRRV